MKGPRRAVCHRDAGRPQRKAVPAPAAASRWGVPVLPVKAKPGLGLICQWDCESNEAAARPLSALGTGTSLRLRGPGPAGIDGPEPSWPQCPRQAPRAL